MSEPLFKIILQGVDQNASTSVDKVVDKLNKAKEATKRWNDERAKMAREDRKDKFRQLSDEEKLARLRERQVQIERRLLTATNQGNQMRAAALRLAAARNRSELGGMGGLGTTKVQGGGGGATAIGGGFIVGGGIGAAMAAVSYAITRAARNSMRFADEISDAAEIAGVTRLEMLQIRRAAGRAGVSSSGAVGSINRFALARSEALSGNEAAVNAFARFGIKAGDLKSSASNLALASKIKASLGSGGMLPTDTGPLAQLFGRNPQKAIAMLNAIQSEDGSMEKTLQTLDSANAMYEDASNKIEETQAKVVGSLMSNLMDFVDNIKWVWDTTFTDKYKGPIQFNNPTSSDVKRTALTGAFKKKIKPQDVAALGAIGSIESASGLARTGFSIGRMDSEGSGLLRKQIDWQEKLYREAREQKQILKEGLL